MTMNPRTISQLISLGSTLASLANQAMIQRSEQEANRLAERYQEFHEKLQQEKNLVAAALEKTFGERRYTLDGMFARLDTAIAARDYRTLEQITLGIIAVLEQNPLHDFENFKKALQDPEFIIEL